MRPIHLPRHPFLILSAGLLAQGCQVQKFQQPNIILFMVDDMGWQDTSVPFWDSITPLNRQFRTPNMERLASQGMLFTQAYASAVSSPTRVSLMSGLNAARHRVTNWTLQKDMAPTPGRFELSDPDWNVNGLSSDSTLKRAVYVPEPLPRVLRDHGYKTIHAGKAHFGALQTPAADPRNIGFDINIAGHAAGGLASYLGTDNFAAPNGSVWDVPGLETYHGKDVFITEALTQEAIKAVDSVRRENKPFFLYMAHYAVHVPIMADERFLNNYQHPLIDPVEAAYASMVEGMDKSLGDLMDYLKREGIDRNTVIVFMSDNGGLSAAGRGGRPHTHNLPLASGKGSVYEGGIRVPMIVRWPGVTKKQTKNDNSVIIEDFYPGILDMAGIRLPVNPLQPVDGKSFAPLLKGKEPRHDRLLVWHYPNDWGIDGPGINYYSACRKGDWKLIYFHRTQHFELYNLKTDIRESYDLAREMPARVRSLAVELGNYLKNVGAQMPSIPENGSYVPYPDEVVTRK